MLKVTQSLARRAAADVHLAGRPPVLKRRRLHTSRSRQEAGPSAGPSHEAPKQGYWCASRRLRSPLMWAASVRDRLRRTPIVWTPIPIGLGIAVLVVVNARKQAQRSGSDELGPEGVKVKGPWQVHVIGALPLRTISRMYGAFNEYTLPNWFRVPGFKLYSFIFGVNLDECEPADLREYRSLSEFFMRRLKPGVRKIEDAPLVSPADGRVVNFGFIENRRINQVKGVTYSMDALLGGTGPIMTNETGEADTGSGDGSVNEEEFASLNGIEYTLDQLIGDEEHHQGKPEPDAEPKKRKQRWYDIRRRFSSKSRPAEPATPAKDASLSDAEREAQEKENGGPSSSLFDHASVALSVAPSNMPWTVKGIPKEGNRMFYCVVYLAPGDYHRFHSPTAWVAERRRHFAGELFSVSPWMAGKLQDLFILNERVALLGRWRHGFFSMTAVGATNVGSIRINFDRDLRTNLRDRPSTAGTFYEASYSSASKLLNGQPLRPGDEMGVFSLGSTIVLVFEAPESFQFGVARNQKVKLGQALGQVP